MIRRQRQFGLTLVEVLVALTLLALVIVPAISALQTGVSGTAVHADLAANHHRLTARMETLLAEPFAALAAAAGSPTVPSSYSDPAGPPARLLVYLAQADGDNADNDNQLHTGADAGLLWIRVEAEGTVHALETLRAAGQ